MAWNGEIVKTEKYPMEIAAIVCYTRGDTRVSPLTEVYMDKQ